MKSAIVLVLVGLNVLLLFLFISQANHPSAAYAQGRRPSDYVLIPVAVQGQPTDVICVVDTSNGFFGGLGYDEVKGKLLPLQTPISLDAVFDRVGK